MKKYCYLLFAALIIVSSGYSRQSGQPEWVFFKWSGLEYAGRYYDKAAIIIPAAIDNLPHKFDMQFDLGAANTVLYGNSIAPYLELYPELRNKLDSTLTFSIQAERNIKFRNMGLKLDDVEFSGMNIGHFAGYGDAVPTDSVCGASVKHIGTIGADFVSDKILIIDYPSQRLRIVEELPDEYDDIGFEPFKMEYGIIRIPMTIGEERREVIFDTGSSLFCLVTSRQTALKISDGVIADSIGGSSWGEQMTAYGMMSNVPVRFVGTELPPALVYFSDNAGLEEYFEREKVFGITGNAWFLNNTVVIDYKNKRFGIK